uniref:5'-3' exoribonuclease n=1 Tax=Hirondellea gigas TaxID=1518452 RepID=A0A6A7FY04_9CRUS
MGVPSFYRWLSEKYPKVVVYVKDDQTYDNRGNPLPVDATQPNPNEIEFDNLYLDMNGIIHPCCHSDDGPAPATETEMIRAIFAYIDHIFAIVRPRKLLFMAIDGVAPRAKMNQQRSRRFRSAQERTEYEIMKKELSERWTGLGRTLPSSGSSDGPWDSNVITPGTPFMDNLAKALRIYIQHRLNSNPAWKDIMVILSDANVPGEGEHKIMQFIRRTRTDPGYNPNTRHCLHGLDADLFMLALATHEPNFTLLREEVLFGRDRICDRCGEKGHLADQCKGEPKPKSVAPRTSPELFQFAHINILREYLMDNLQIRQCPFWNFERVIDDFVFLCFFVGNDFLPHLPSLEIREGAIDHLIDIYKQELVHLGGFLTENGEVDLQRVCVLLRRLGDIEDDVLRERSEDQKRWESRQARDKERAARESRKRRPPISAAPVQFIPAKGGENQLKASEMAQTQTRKQLAAERLEEKELTMSDDIEVNGELQSEPPIKKSKTETGSIPSLSPSTSSESSLVIENGDEKEDVEEFKEELKRQRKANADISQREDQQDTVLLGTSGWKGRYYKAKLGADYNPDNQPDILKRLFHSYAEGLKWVFKYYYDGCTSWTWYFEFHYAPFASDLVQIFEDPVVFELGKPFAPLAQLMGVLPAASGHCLPNELSDLMKNPESPIIDFYPLQFKLDLNGKKFAWQAVALLPFIEEKRLLDVITPIFETLSDERKRMNSVGPTYLFINAGHPLSNTISSLYLKPQADSAPVDTKESGGIAGFLKAYMDATLPNGTLPPALMGTGSEGWNSECPHVSVISSIFELPIYEPHITKLLANAVLPAATLTQRDITFYQHNNRRFGRQRNRRQTSSHFDLDRGKNLLVGWKHGEYRAYHQPGGIDHEYQPYRNQQQSVYGSRPSNNQRGRSSQQRYPQSGRNQQYSRNPQSQYYPPSYRQPQQQQQQYQYFQQPQAFYQPPQIYQPQMNHQYQNLGMQQQMPPTQGGNQNYQPYQTFKGTYGAAPQGGTAAYSAGYQQQQQQMPAYYQPYATQQQGSAQYTPPYGSFPAHGPPATLNPFAKKSRQPSRGK